MHILTELLPEDFDLFSKNGFAEKKQKKLEILGMDSSFALKQIYLFFSEVLVAKTPEKVRN
jgi:hypothetical protein